MFTFSSVLITLSNSSLKLLSFSALVMENYVISPDERFLRWTCTVCQFDNLFTLRFAVFPDKVKWRCSKCGIVEVVYEPQAWIREAMSIYIAIHQETEKRKLRGLREFKPENI